MKCFRDTVTLFCPTGDGVTTEYLLRGVRLRLREEIIGRGGVLFVFGRRSSAFVGDSQVPMPRIFTGCSVVSGDVRGVMSPPSSVVIGVETFSSESGRGDHTKVLLG